MEKKTKIWLIIAASLVLIGCIIFGGVMRMLKWDFTKLSTNKYETKNYEITEEFKEIAINTNTADITFTRATDGKCSVMCYEYKNEPHSVVVKDNTLVIEVIDSRKWYEHIGINFGSPKITVYLPETEYISLLIEESTGDVDIPNDFCFNDVDISLSTGAVNFMASTSNAVKIKTSTGAIHVENISAGTLDLSVSTGKVNVSSVICEGDITVGVTTGKTYLSDIQCRNVFSSGSTGNISLENVIAAGKFSINRSTGKVRFSGSDATEIFVKTSTGDVEGSLLTDKIFIVRTDTGNIDVPKSVNGGKCEITTKTGDIEIIVE